MKTIFFFFSEKEVKDEAGAVHSRVLQLDRTCAVFITHPASLQPFTSSRGFLSTPVANSPRGPTPRSLQSLLTDESISSVLFLPVPTAHNVWYYGPQYLLR